MPGSTSLPRTSIGLLRRPGQVLGDRGDAAIAHGDIEKAVEALGRIDDAAAAQHEVVGRGLHDIHGGSPRGAAVVHGW